VAANIVGPYLCASRAVELMRVAAGGGGIVNISSVGGFRAHWRGLPYDATKGAIDAMTRAMAIELAEYGIRVNAVAPGATRTDRSPAPESELAGRIRKRVPLGRFGAPVEIGHAVAFLASDDAAYITGQVLYVDGGVTAQLDPKTNPT
jgi:NAD(P)-dependent dehydrogenase (short-subunit alcohol dehydrogenase family)